ncbi:SDR family oxidoreductase [Cryptosporangium phraense]|uniref:SDR family oxidoreductase n=1 Tax=Cryptosporangium phraense TaxID=2593070 RepID=A0A545AX15_9ACTN|nr:SDR family oxidoreductase [Cryptosporangium phraense]TQS45879.1 SDR family oxidoreductase [Cryptosporangium phraense]
MALSSSSHVVVLGGTSGIGQAVARAAAAAGARVSVGGRSSDRPVDVTSSASLAAFFAAAGPFDHLVYTAGDALARGPLTDYRPQLARDFFGVRLFSALDAVRLALPTLSPTGSVTLTSGAAAFHGGPGRLLGSTVSGAVITAARSLAVELAPIRVNVVAPGIVRTPLWAGAPEDVLASAAQPDDVAKAYLAFLEQDHVTGNVAVVDGGSSLGAQA